MTESEFRHANHRDPRALARGVRDKRLVLPDGTSYGLLVLPPREMMRPEVPTRLAIFVDGGLSMFGASFTPSRPHALDEVTLNGAPSAPLWNVPHRVDITSAVKAGEDVL